MHLPDAGATEAAGRLLATHLCAGDIVALNGELGAGKTSFARGLIAGLGFSEDVPSPSFPIVIPYDPPQVRFPVWHVDLYRLDGAEDVVELGLDEALADGALLIEWPERLGDQLWPDALKLYLTLAEAGGRNLTALVPPSWEGRCPFP